MGIALGILRLRLIILLIWLSLPEASTLKGRRESLEELISKRFKGKEIKTLIRPGLNSDFPLDVHIGLYVFTVMALKLKEQVMDLSGALYIKWTDESLKWDPLLYNNITEIKIPQSMIWTPDIVLFNALGNDFDNVLGHDDLLLTVKADGQIVWEVGFSKTFHCALIATKYPFDSNICTIDLCPWVSDNTSMHLALDNDHITVHKALEDNSEFQISLERAETETVSSFDFTFEYVKIYLKFTRRPMFIVITLLLPISLLSILCSLSFLISPDQSEKLTLSITSLLSVTVFVSIVDDTLPKGADSIALLAVYVALIVCHAFLTVIGNVLVLMSFDTEKRTTKPQSATCTQIVSSISLQNSIADRPKNDMNGNAEVRTQQLFSKEDDLQQSLKIPQSKISKTAKMNRCFFLTSFISSLLLTFLFWISISVER